MDAYGQGTKWRLWRRTLPKISTGWVGCTNVTDRQTTDRQTDGFATASTRTYNVTLGYKKLSALTRRLSPAQLHCHQFSTAAYDLTRNSSRDENIRTWREKCRIVLFTYLLLSIWTGHSPRHKMDHTQVNLIQLKTFELELDFAEYLQY